MPPTSARRRTSRPIRPGRAPRTPPTARSRRHPPRAPHARCAGSAAPPPPGGVPRALPPRDRRLVRGQRPLTAGAQLEPDAPVALERIPMIEPAAVDLVRHPVREGLAVGDPPVERGLRLRVGPLLQPHAGVAD